MRTLSVGALAVTLTLGVACRSETTFTPFAGYAQLDSDHGQWLSMSVAPDGSPSMAFYDRTDGALGFAIGEVRANGIDWTYEEPDGYPDSGGLDAGDVGTYTSHAWAPDGTAWVAYHTPGQGSLKVAHRVGRTWTSEVVDGGSGLRPNTGRWTSMAIDSAGNPIVIYHDEVAGTLQMARYDGTAWSTDTIFEGEAVIPEDGGDERPADVGEYADLIVDGNTHYIAFYDRAKQDLVLLEGFAGAYVETRVATEGDVGQWPSLWKDGETVAIAYHDVTNQDLVLAVREGGGSFTKTVLDDGRKRGADTAVFRRDARWGVAYFDGRSNDIRLAAQTGEGAWDLTRIGGEDGAQGYHNEVIVDGGGVWWSGTYDYTSRKPVVRRIE